MIVGVNLLLTGAGIGMGLVIGGGRGEARGYQLGYHEGGFDAIHMPDLFAEKEAANGH